MGNTMDDTAKEEYIIISQYRKSFFRRLQLLNRAYTKYEFGRTRLSVRCQILLGLM